jgi:hypothetical protein
MRKFQIAICATAALGFCLMVPKGASAFPAADSASKAYTQTVESKSAATPVRYAGRVGGVGFRGVGVRGIGYGRGIGWRGRAFGFGRGIGWRRGYYGGWGGYGLGLGYGLGTGLGYGGSYAATSGGCYRGCGCNPCGCGGGGLFGGLFF